MLVRVIFSKQILVTGGLLATAVFGLAAYVEHSSEVGRKETEASKASKNLVRAEELEFTDMRLGPESFGSSYNLTGRVRNNSRYTVTDVQAKIRLLDCDEKEHCDVIGEEDQDIVTDVPARQARDIQSSIFFGSGTRVRGHFKWSYVLNGIGVHLPSSDWSGGWQRLQSSFEEQWNRLGTEPHPARKSNGLPPFRLPTPRPY
jgi:hypothetical protein